MRRARALGAFWLRLSVVVHYANTVVRRFFLRSFLSVRCEKHFMIDSRVSGLTPICQSSARGSRAYGWIDRSTMIDLIMTSLICRDFLQLNPRQIVIARY